MQCYMAALLLEVVLACLQGKRSSENAKVLLYSPYINPKRMSLTMNVTVHINAGALAIRAGPSY